MYYVSAVVQLNGTICMYLLRHFFNLLMNTKFFFILSDVYEESLYYNVNYGYFFLFSFIMPCQCKLYSL